jgi:adenosylhomocysteine nucleosidase
VILVLAADPLELQLLCDIKSLKGSPLGIEGNLSGQQVRFVASGPGVKNARAAVEAVCAQQTPSAIVSAGYVGALDPALEVGQIFLARRVKRIREKVDYQGELPAFPSAEGVAQGTLLTIDRVAQTSQEKGMLRQSGADAVDMEAYAVAGEARQRSIPFYCVRVVSDHAYADFPVDFNRARRPDGTFAGWKILAQAGFSSSRWQRLLDLKRDAELASERLAAFLSTCTFQ